MRWTPLRFWLITTANALLLCIVLLVIFGILMALAVMAPEIESWPLLTFGGIGLATTLFGLYFTRLARTRKQRWTGWTVHGISLAMYLLIALLITKSWLTATRRTFLFADGYKGDVYVIHAPVRGPFHRQHSWRTIYRVPSDGILIISDPMPELTNDEYAYAQTAGRVRRITDMEYSTVSNTPQNRSDLTPIMYFPRTGSFQSRSGCTVQFEEVYVGTKADLLTNHKQTDLEAYLATHPDICSTTNGKGN